MTLLFQEISQKCSKITTQKYSTSFSFGIKTLAKKYQQPIYSIYGFVRFADEIVDSFHNHNKLQLLDEFETDCYNAIERGISLNPILNSFQHVVNHYNIDPKLIQQFLYSMRMDLEDKPSYLSLIHI